MLGSVSFKVASNESHIIDRINQAISEHEELKKPAPKDDELRKTLSSFMVKSPDQDKLFDESDMFGLEEPEFDRISEINWASILKLVE